MRILKHLSCMVIAWGAAFLLCYVSFQMNQAAEEKVDALGQQRLQQYGEVARIAEVYRQRTGTKPANYRIHEVAVLENVSGKRIETKMVEQLGAEGEVWNIRYDDCSNSIVLDSLREETVLPEKVPVPPPQPETSNELHCLWAFGNALVFPTLLILTLVLGVCGMFAFVAIIMCTCSFGFMDKVDRQGMYEASYVVCAAVSTFALFGMCMATETLLPATAAVGMATGGGMICGFILCLVILGICMYHS